MDRASRRSWTGYAEGRLYAAGGRDLARETRGLARRMEWGEIGPLSGPHLELHDPRRAILLRVDVRRVPEGSWVLVRSEIGNPGVVADLFTAETVARLFHALEGEVLDGASATARAVLPADRQDWPEDVDTLGAENGRAPCRRYSGRIFRLPVFVASLVVVLVTVGRLASGRGLWSTLFPGLFSAAWLGILAGGALLALIALVWLILPAQVARRTELSLAWLTGERPPDPGKRQDIDVTPGGMDPDPRLEGARLQWRTAPGLCLEVGRRWAATWRGSWILAITAMLPVVAVIALLRPLAVGLLPQDSTVFEFLPIDTIDALALAVLQLLAAVVAFPLLGGMLALREREALSGVEPGVPALLHAAAVRLPAYFLAQLRVALGVIGLLAIAIVLASLVPLAAPLLAILALPAIAIWLMVHVFVGPVAFLEPEASPLGRSRALTRGMRGWIFGALILGAGLEWFAWNVASAGWGVLVWHNPLVNWLPDRLLALGEAVFLLGTAPLAALFLAHAYFNMRCFREGLDLELARREVPDASPSPADPSPRLRWAALGVVLVAAIVGTDLVTGGAVRASTNDHGRRVFEALQAGETERARDLVLELEDARHRDDDGWTLLHHAAGSGDLGLVRALVETGSDVNARTVEGQTPLDVAAGIASIARMSGGRVASHERVRDYLIEHGGRANVSTAVQELDTILQEVQGEIGGPPSAYEMMRNAAEAAKYAR